jgi:hypothetical protein
MAKKNKDKGEAAAEAAEPRTIKVSLSEHPRARAGIRRVRTRAALIAFALVLVLNLMADQTAFDATWRALLAGIVVNVIAWRCAIVVWRHVVLQELRDAEERHNERVREERERLQQLAAEQASSRPFRAA